MYLWKSAICAGCGACGYYYGLRYNQQLAFYCATCKDILHSFLREYRKYHSNISVEQRINDKIKFSWPYDGGFCVGSINQETTVKIMQQFMDYVKSAPHGIVCYQSRGIWLGSDYPT
ncbi:hypothetical protein D5b_00233 [Faustovirus]|nr:hypothetical protein D5b_00233 [Faustovirus]AMN84681.1 hypothetical protein D6_00278 [Faustovirus]AMP44185.1 hypothetical protein PRJ_Dakar_00229 [Faustovirus]